MTPRPMTFPRSIALMLAMAAMMMCAAIYGIQAAESNAQKNKQAYSKGYMAAFVFKSEWTPVSTFPFKNGKDEQMSLADWKGRVVLLNLWATWCAPCRREMPGLDRLQAELGGEDFEVVALSVDRKGKAASAKFLDEINVKNLGLYVDKTNKAFFEMRARGLPATYLIDREGRLIGRLIGPAEWDSDEAKALIQAAIDNKLAPPTN